MRSERLSEGEVRVGRVGVRQVALVRDQGRVHVFKNNCPHAGAPLSAGEVCDGTVVCPRHRWRFLLHTGACVDQPLYELRLYDVEERDGWIYAAERETEIW